LPHLQVHAYETLYAEGMLAHKSQPTCADLASSTQLIIHCQLVVFQQLGRNFWHSLKNTEKNEDNVCQASAQVRFLSGLTGKCQPS